MILVHVFLISWKNYYIENRLFYSAVIVYSLVENQVILTSKIASTSMGALKGRLATPTADREW